MIVELLARPKGGEGVKSGPIGLAVILVLCVAAYFLFKSMSKHLKKVRTEFPLDDAQQAAPQPMAPTDDAGRDRPGQPGDAKPAPPGQPPPAP